MATPESSTAKPPLSPALADALVAGRPQFNARVAEIRQRYPTFDADAFAAFLRTGLDAVARAVATVAPDRTGFVVSAAYDIALELVAQGLVGPGARTDVIDRVWCMLAPSFARMLAAEPVEVLGLLSNAVLHIAGVQGARVDEWQRAMVECAPRVESTSQLRGLGQVLAWRAGLAHFREGALCCADGLPEALAMQALGGAGDRAWSEVRERYLRNPWWSPRPERRAACEQGMRVGRFAGFGGSFTQPPEVRGCGQGFLVRSENRFSLLIADVHGAVLLPATESEFAQAAGDGSMRGLLSGSILTIGSRRIDVQLPQDGLAIAGNDDTIAVTSPYTHAIRLVPRA